MPREQDPETDQLVSHTPDLTRPLAIWIARLAEIEPAVFSVLQTAGIYTDRDYASSRKTLAEPIRIVADRHRFRFQTAGIALNDPFVVARFLPPWGLTAPLSSLGLSQRARNIFAIATLRTVKDVLALGPFGITEIPNLGKATIRELAERIHAYVADDVLNSHLPTAESTTATDGNPPEHTLENTPQIALQIGDLHREDILPSPPTLRAGLDTALQRLKERDAEVLRLWLGFAGVPFVLEEIGSRLGVTRERARQLRNRAFADLQALWPLTTELSRRLSSLLLSREEPLYLDIIASEDVWFDGFQDSVAALGRLIEEFAGEDIQIWILDGRLIGTRCRAERWEDLVSGAKMAVEREISTALSRAEARTLVCGVAIEENAYELAGVLWGRIEPLLHFAVDVDGQPRLAAVGRGSRPGIRAILEESDRPLHIAEIAERLRLRGGAERDDEGTRNVLRTKIRESGGLLFGRSVYGLEKHLPISSDIVEEIIPEIEAIMLSGLEGRQWHCSELADTLSMKRPDLGEELDRYAVNILLQRSTIARYLRRLVWVAAPGSETQQDRLDVAALCEAALLQAGRPLSKRELRDAVSSVRGLNHNFLPQTSERVIRLAHGMWGLADRDVGVSLENQKVALDGLHDALSIRQKGLHVTELFGALAMVGIVPDPELDQWELLGLAQTDTRFRVGRGQIVGLSSWSDVRRYAIGQALLELQRRNLPPMLGERLYQEVCELLERTIPRASVASHAARLGFTFDSITGLWSTPSAEVIDDSDEEA